MNIQLDNMKAKVDRKPITDVDKADFGRVLKSAMSSLDRGTPSLFPEDKGDGGSVGSANFSGRMGGGDSRRSKKLRRKARTWENFR